MSGDTNMFKNSLNKFHNVQTVSSSLAGILVALYCFVSRRSVVEWGAMESTGPPTPRQGSSSTEKPFQDCVWVLREPDAETLPTLVPMSVLTPWKQTLINLSVHSKLVLTHFLDKPQSILGKAKFSTHIPFVFFFHKEISRDPKVSEPKMLQ